MFVLKYLRSKYTYTSAQTAYTLNKLIFLNSVFNFAKTVFQFLLRKSRETKKTITQWLKNVYRAKREDEATVGYWADSQRNI